MATEELQHRRSHRLAHGLAAFELGVLSAASLLVGSQRFAPAVYEALFRMKTGFSNLLGSHYGWTEHVRRHEPIGAWLQFAVLTAIFSVLWLVLLRGLKGSRRLRAWGEGVLAMAAPWVFLAITADATLVGDRRRAVIVTVLGLLAGALAIGAVIRGPWKLAVCLMGCSIAAYTVVLRLASDFVTAPVGHVVSVASAGLFACWAMAISVSGREGVSEGP